MTRLPADPDRLVGTEPELEGVSRGHKVELGATDEVLPAPLTAREAHGAGQEGQALAQGRCGAEVRDGSDLGERDPNQPGAQGPGAGRDAKGTTRAGEADRFRGLDREGLPAVVHAWHLVGLAPPAIETREVDGFVAGSDDDLFAFLSRLLAGPERVVLGQGGLRGAPRAGRRELSLNLLPAFAGGLPGRGVGRQHQASVGGLVAVALQAHEVFGPPEGAGGPIGDLDLQRDLDCGLELDLDGPFPAAGQTAQESEGVAGLLEIEGGRAVALVPKLQRSDGFEAGLGQGRVGGAPGLGVFGEAAGDPRQAAGPGSLQLLEPAEGPARFVQLRLSRRAAQAELFHAGGGLLDLG